MHLRQHIINEVVFGIDSKLQFARGTTCASPTAAESKSRGTHCKAYQQLLWHRSVRPRITCSQS